MLTLNMVAQHCGECRLISGLGVAVTKVSKCPSNVSAASLAVGLTLALCIVNFGLSRNKHVGIVDAAIMMQHMINLSGVGSQDVRSITQGRYVPSPVCLDPVPHVIAVA